MFKEDFLSSILLVMKFAQGTSPLPIACLAHLTHVCICDVSYKEKRNSNERDVENNIVINTEEEDSHGAEDETAENNLAALDVVLVLDFRTIVAKARKTVKLFIISAVCSNDNLQPQHTTSFGKDKFLGIAAPKRSSAFTSCARK